ncbi:MAG: T9SS type A sorting domain-containing protein [Chitinophagales bacterium]|nr:T9SS type A sorting domain-containing protein [Sphingobacteriales bacterium]MBP7533570.1 T9SS type A sorting domain-containing protein [Chitinophagales bacterium]
MMKIQTSLFKQITPTEEANLRAIAASQTKTAFDAQALLHAARGHEFAIHLPDLNLGAGNSNWQTSFKTFDNKVGKLYPNPATNQVQLAHYLDTNQKGVLNLYDMMGQQLSSHNFMGTGTQTINVANLPTGLYHYTIVVENTTVVKDKIVIIK